MKSPRLTSMSFNTLVALRAQIDQLIGRRVKEEVKFYQRKLAELAGFDGGQIEGGRKVIGRKKANGRKTTRRKAAIKYRGPKGEKWSGRGMTPLWMRPLLKKGKKKEEFLVKVLK